MWSCGQSFGSDLGHVGIRDMWSTDQNHGTRVTCINHANEVNHGCHGRQTVRKGAQEPIQMSQRSMQYLTALRAIFDALGEMNRRVFALVPNLNKPTDAR